MKTIVFLSQNLSYGGAYKIMIRIANNLAEIGDYRVRILNLGVNKNYYGLNETISIDNYNIKNNGRLISKVMNLAYRFYVSYRYLKKSNADLVIAFDNTEKLIAVLCSKILKNCKSLISERKDPYSYSKKKRYMYWRYDHADGIVFQTEGARDYFSSIVKKKSVVIPNFIEDPNVNVIPYVERTDSICFSGRFDIDAKNPFLLLHAFKLIANQYPTFKLDFYGDGNKKYGNIGTLKKEAESLGISDKVNFHGVVFPVTKEIAKSKIFVITSNYEGIPNSLLEAMSCGLPVISTDCSPGGARLLIENLHNGIIIPRDDVKSLAFSISYVIDNPHFAESIGANAKRVLDDYHPSKILNSWREYIEVVLMQ